MKKISITLVILLFAVVSSLTLSHAQAPPVPLSIYLNDDGRLSTPPDFRGSLDPSGWKLEKGLRGEPVFTSSNMLVDPADSSWDGRFDTLGMNSSVYAIAVMGTDLYVGGTFTRAGAVAASFIARWDGAKWYALGSGVNNAVRALAVQGTNLYVGGDFTAAGGSGANYIARWNGSTWSALGMGLNNFVFTLSASGPNIYAGGQSTTAGGSGANYIARWNGSAWSSLGTGMDGIVYALYAEGPDLYAGGLFSKAGGVPASNIARWDGAAWNAVGGGADGYVLAIARSGSDLIAAGGFANAGGGAASNIARWDGSRWTALGAGVDHYVFSLATNGPAIYAGGYYTKAGGSGANYIARYDAGEWSKLGSGVDSLPVRALASVSGSVYAGGGFSAAGTKPSRHFGRWSIPAHAVSTAIPGGWNMISLPLAVANKLKTAIFPAAVSNAFAYEPPAGYSVKDTIRTMVGYWLKYPSALTVRIIGAPNLRDSAITRAGWNLIGAVAVPILRTAIVQNPPSNVASSYFEYVPGSGYVIADTLKPGRAFWVKTNVAGKLTLDVAGALPKPVVAEQGEELQSALESLNELVFQPAAEGAGAARLYFGLASEKFPDLERYSLPPAPPVEAADVRFASDRYVELLASGQSGEIPIMVQGDRPSFRLSWTMKEELGFSYVLVERTGPTVTREQPLRGTGSMTLTSGNRYAIRLQDLPAAFALLQNYPNPFNPTTSLRFDLPAASWVTLKVFNVLGLLVATIVEGVEPAGTRVKEWDAAHLASGIYFYRLTAVGTDRSAGTATFTKKMLLVK